MIDRLLNEKKLLTGKKLNKGELTRQMMWVIILLILAVLILALFYSAAYEMIHDFIMGKILPLA